MFDGLGGKAWNVPQVGETVAYQDDWEHLADELLRLDVLLKRQYDAMRIQEMDFDPTLEMYKGLVVTEQEVETLFEREESDKTDEENRYNELLGHWDVYIKDRLSKSKQLESFLPLVFIRDLLGLSDLEYRALVICLAPHINRKYEKIFAYLQNDVNCKYSTVDLVLTLLLNNDKDRLKARNMFSDRGTLSRFLLVPNDEGSFTRTTFLSAPLRVDERIVNFIARTGQLDDSLRMFTRIIDPQNLQEPLLWGEDTQNRIKSFIVSQYSNGNQPEQRLAFHLWGPPGGGKKLHVKHICAHFNQPVMIVDMRRFHDAVQERSANRLLDRIVREALLEQALLCFIKCEALFTDDEQHNSRQMFVINHALSMMSGPVFFLSERHLPKLRELTEMLWVEMDIHAPTDTVRKRLWGHLCSELTFAESPDWTELAGKFRLTVGQMKNALTEAKALSYWEASQELITDGAKPGITTEQLHRGCYTQIQHGLAKKARRLSPKYGLDDLVLPDEQREQLNNACMHIKYREIVFGEWGFGQKLSYGKGLSLMFAGPPGTGKTMAAEVIAKELSLDIYKIDLSQVISKYIGETEKNLHEIFHEAQLSHAILFFDEADALFGKRSEVKDSHDKYANVETAYLLQKMEEYEGITILATNFSQNLDDAFMRRFNYVVKFPFPDAAYREKIWRSMFPSNVPLGYIDYAFLGTQFAIAGGNIKNIAVSAAFLAAEQGESVGMNHIITATKQELKKTGKLLLKDDLGEYSHMNGG